MDECNLLTLDVMFLDLSQNRMTSIVPTSLSSLVSSSYDVSDNLLSGISDELCESQSNLFLVLFHLSLYLPPALKV